MNKKIALLGIGGIGGYLAYSLLTNGIKPILVTNNEAITYAINTHGLIVNDSMIKAEALTSLEHYNGSFDIIMLIMKANTVVDAVEKAIPFLSNEGYMVSMQNGIVEDVLQEILGDRLISSIIGFGATMLKPGVYEKTSEGEIFIGELDGSVSNRVEELQSILSFAAPCVISRNMRGVLWSKLAINSCINTIGALTGDTLGVLLKQKVVRWIFLVVYREVVETAWENGITLEKVAAKPTLLYMPKNAGFMKKIIKDILISIVGKKYGKLRSSSLQSLERGRETEIDYLNGYVIKMAKNTDVRMNTILVDIIKEIEAKKREISQDNISDVLSLYGSF
ncbi:MAG: 2-dehydropantoate 2-reductase [Candidatus Heimdallarchaeota archaeon]|nr:2-dehydropantoate 2-reductase [Candidatus Heimdallarchaeota archaeon]